MPVFDSRKVSEKVILCFAIIGFIVVGFFVARKVVNSSPLAVVVACITPIIAFIWTKYKIALVDKYEMSSVTIAMLFVSFFLAFYIGSNNGKVQSYFSSLLLQGHIVKYEQYVEAQEIYEGRKTIPPHYDSAYKFESNDKISWKLTLISYIIGFVCVAIPIINYFIAKWSYKKTVKMQENDNYNKRRKEIIHLNLK